MDSGSTWSFSRFTALAPQAGYLDSCDLLQGAPSDPNSQGRGAALGGELVPMPQRQSRPWSSHDWGVLPAPHLLSPCANAPQAACGRMDSSPHKPDHHPLAGKAPRALKASSGHACHRACRAMAEEVGVQAGADPASWSLMRRHLLQENFAATKAGTFWLV